MEINEKHNNPNSHKRLRRATLSSWSDLPTDLLNLVFKRLSFPNFQRAKSVCPFWHSASRQSEPKHSQLFWLVLFPIDNKNSSSCTLFNPEEPDKLYRTQDLGLEFAKSVCMATYGSWFLMRDPRYKLYIVNIFTHERINLPPVESQLGMIKIERTKDDYFRVTGPNGIYKSNGISISLFWIDEKTKDYIVLWGLVGCCVVYSRKGDTSWKQIPETSDCYDMFYKDHKLYLLSFSSCFEIFDFSGAIPQHTSKCGVIGEGFPLTQPRVVGTKLVVTVTGQVLKVEQIWRMRSRTWSFRVFKIGSSGFVEKQEVVNSLGDETLLFDQGIIVLANDTDGFIRDSIYFSCSNGNTNEILLFNLKTRKTESVHKFDSSSVQFSRAQWFLPSFTQTLS